MNVDYDIMYTLPLWSVFFPDNNTYIRRVPWWWVYANMQWVCFIPFNNEFMK